MCEAEISLLLLPLCCCEPFFFSPNTRCSRLDLPTRRNPTRSPLHHRQGGVVTSFSSRFSPFSSSSRFAPFSSSSHSLSSRLGWRQHLYACCKGRGHIVDRRRFPLPTRLSPLNLLQRPSLSSTSEFSSHSAVASCSRSPAEPLQHIHSALSSIAL